MTEALQTEDCLNSQTCCEVARRPFKERKLGPWNHKGEPLYTESGIREFNEAPRQEPCEVNQVIQERMSLYGPPEVNLDCIARHWQAYLDNRNPGPLTLQDVCNMMCLAKISRMARTPEHADSAKDIKAYRQIAEGGK